MSSSLWNRPATLFLHKEHCTDGRQDDMQNSLLAPTSQICSRTIEDVHDTLQQFTSHCTVGCMNFLGYTVMTNQHINTFQFYHFGVICINSFWAKFGRPCQLRQITTNYVLDTFLRHIYKTQFQNALIKLAHWGSEQLQPVMYERNLKNKTKKSISQKHFVKAHKLQILHLVKNVLGTQFNIEPHHIAWLTYHEILFCKIQAT